MNKKINEIIELLKADQDNLYADGAFAYFINNQINAKELNEILLAGGIKLPDSFFELSIYEQKNYRRWWQTTVYYENKNFIQETRVIFNPVYFYDIAEHARKTVSFTNKLIKYVYDLESINLLFFGMQYIKIKNTKLARYSKLINFAESKGINDLYELTIELCAKKSTTQEMLDCKKLLKEKLKDDSFIGIDLDDPFTKLCLFVEALFYCLPRKEANTLKTKFLIMPKSYFRTIDYYDCNKPTKQLLKDYESYFSSSAISQLLKYSKENQQIFSGTKPNGYLAFYYAFVEGKQ